MRDIYVEIVIDMTSIISDGIPNCCLVACKNPDKVETKITDVCILLTVLVRSLYFKSSRRLFSLHSFNIKLFILR